jgi:hypothetical protein
VEDRDLDAIDALIEVGICTTRSEAQGIARQVILRAETQKLAREGTRSEASSAPPAADDPPAISAE